MWLGMIMAGIGFGITVATYQIVFMRAQYRKSRFNQITYKSACNKRHGKLRNLMSIDAVFHG